MVKMFYKYKTVDGDRDIKRVPLSNILILKEAERCGVEWEKIPYTKLYKLTYNGVVKFFHFQIPSETSSSAVYCCNNKRITRNILSKSGISVSNGFLIRGSDKDSYRLSVFNSLKKPVVVKPTNLSQAKNVSIGISSKKEYVESIDKINQYNGGKKTSVLVEEMFVGDEYRILTSREKILGVMRRIPANLIGDGKSTIEELIIEKNKDPLRGEYYPLSKIVINKLLIDHINSQGLNLDSIVEKNKKIFLLKKSPTPIDDGGDTVDVTGCVHSSVHEIVSRIMKAIPGLSLAGIDYMTKDISKVQTEENYSVIEINASPSIDWQELPAVGEQRNISFEFLKIMFPDLRPTKIP
ncbi:hypothetical protein ACFL1M_01440 [Patescibacteria group bacterium]